MSLTPKQAKFVEEYIIDLNGTQAAIRAGYSVDSARQIAAENLTKPYVWEALQELKEKHSHAAEVDANWIAEKLKEAIKRSLDNSKDEGSNLKGDHRFNGSTLTRSLELLGKMTGHIVDVSKIQIDDRIFTQSLANTLAEFPEVPNEKVEPFLRKFDSEVRKLAVR